MYGRNKLDDLLLAYAEVNRIAGQLQDIDLKAFGCVLEAAGYIAEHIHTFVETACFQAVENYHSKEEK